MMDSAVLFTINIQSDLSCVCKVTCILHTHIDYLLFGDEIGADTRIRNIKISFIRPGLIDLGRESVG